jgi:hypothetical protein
MTRITVEQLIMLVAILFIIYFVLNIKETFELLNSDNKESKPNSKPKSTECSETAINNGYTDYIFGGVKFIR